MKRLALVLVAATAVTPIAVGAAGRVDPVCVEVAAGDGWYAVARAFAPGWWSTATQAQKDAFTQIVIHGAGKRDVADNPYPNEIVCINPARIPGGAPSTSTTSSTSTSVSSTSTTTSSTTSTSSPTTAPPTTSSTSTTIPQSGDPVADIGVGGALPSEATCAARVISMSENRPANAQANNTRGSSPNNLYPRVTGNFVGTTDEILQWAACKWGVDPNWARAQAIVESFWDQSGVPGDNGESFGILQVRRPYHGSAFEDENAVRSTAYNADYTFENWRRCFEGHNDYAWLNTVERGREYAAGDGLGCMGVWFAGRWYTAGAVDYMNKVTQHHAQETWRQSWFPPAEPD